MKSGTVHLVGAGPGDPGLITLRGLECLESADVIVYDRLVDRRLLRYARPQAELVDVGKSPGERGERQQEINRLLVDRATQDKDVVRLKGGDPFVFGRGGEEAEFLRAHHVPFEVVPGISSALAAPAYAGIPLTHRDLAPSFTVMTGSRARESSKDDDHDQQFVYQGGTLVVLMGWENLVEIVERLVDGDWPPDTPAALVRWGTEPYQQTVVGTLSDIVSRAVDAGLAPPVVAIFGQVVELRKRLRWFDNRPLFGKRVLITRTRVQSSALSKLLVQRGAQPVELPTIVIEEPKDYEALDEALGRLRSFDWVIFTSANTVDAVFGRLGALALDTRALGGVRVAAIGAATAASLAGRGIVSDFAPVAFESEGIVEGLSKAGLNGQRVLLPRSDIARQRLTRGLASLGATVEEVTAYRNVTPEDACDRLDDALSEGIDIATFTSASTVKNLVDLLDGKLERISGATIACIGPITAAAARQRGLKVDVVAREHLVQGLVDDLEAYFSARGALDG